MNGVDLVQQQQFTCNNERLKLISKWKGIYGKKFDDLTVVEQSIEKKEKYKKEDKYRYGGVHFKGKKSWNGYKD
jgi:hypothetical protein